MQLNEDLSNEDLRILFTSLIKECYRRINKKIEFIEVKDTVFTGNYVNEISVWAKNSISGLQKISQITYVQPIGSLAPDYMPDYTAEYNTLFIDKIGNCYIADVAKYSLEVLTARNRISELEEEIKSIKSKFELTY